MQGVNVAFVHYDSVHQPYSISTAISQTDCSGETKLVLPVLSS